MTTDTGAGAAVQDFDAIVVGAGLSGLYALHHLRELGFSAHVVEAGDGVGGTWYWNRYPGARCDVPSMEYSYGFSPELEQEWDWTEVFPAQEELERYFNHVADRFDLRRDIQLGTRVTAATYDEDRTRWLVETDRDDRFSLPVPRDGHWVPVAAARTADPGTRHVHRPVAVHERVARGGARPHAASASG